MSGTPPPRGNGSSAGGGGGYPPPPPTATSILGSIKLTANDNNYQHHHHSQIPFDQTVTGTAHHHHMQQQQPPVKVHHRNGPSPPQQSSDRLSAMLPMYHHHHHNRPPLDSQAIPLESRPEYRDFKGGDKETGGSREGGGAENREFKYDQRVRERDAYYPGYAGAGAMNWKESKDHYSLGTTVDLTTKRHSNFNLQGSPIQEGSSVLVRDNIDPQEAVAENRIDPKADDRYKEKDRKRKELKHRDLGDGERDKDRSERRLNLGVKEQSAREDDRWDRNKKDTSSDREKSKETEKDGLNSEKEPSRDVSGRTPERENSTLEHKNPKENYGWEMKKERDGDVETERPEKRSRVYEKESDDGCGESDLGAENERDSSFSYGVQQRKRMLRPRGSPQLGPRFRNEGSQGKPKVSTVRYSVGSCMQELMKLWKEYESSRADENGENSQATPTLEIRIPAESITATKHVRGGQLWGTDVYTDDSDLVAVLMHTGYCRPTASPPPPAIQELCATVRVLPPQDCYTSTLRNNVRSRAWGAAVYCSYRVEHCCIFKKGGGTIDLEPCLTHTSTVEPTLAPVAVERTITTRAAASNALRQQRFVREITIQYNMCNEPWIKYSLGVVADKGLKKPLYTSARLKKGEVLYLETHSCRYELCFSGEKMVKGAMSSEKQDMNVEKTQSHNLHGAISNGDTILVDVFRWSRCKRPLPHNLLRSSGIPLPSQHLEVLEENLDWEDIEWSQTGVFIAGKEYALARVHFMSPN